MKESEDKLRTELMEAILEYIEGSKTFRSVLTLGITAHNKNVVENQNIRSVLFELNSMGNQVANGNNYSRENIKEIFTTMLEKLTKD